ncbi:unnamed protein product [Medioppia subpectinata]|uniref:histone acetyltransferase n=1 Tax=Medioppia subpectinata TaxID=1979941 RepID=A0A7R9L6Y6_9ACAR|nr:unnamed protein product [Medioppia subpectinata]CAG2116287.1 unnamed protein product [Medioppia subpectinata]
MLNESGDSTSDGISIHTCRTCETRLVDIRYHCGQCDHFDLCVACYQRHGHTHPMDQLTFIGQWVEVAPVAKQDGNTGRANACGDGSSNAPPVKGETRRLSIQRCIQSLVHACQCSDANCRLPSCHKMKRVVQHAKSCKRKSSQPNQTAAPGCPICKQLIALCCYHAKHCLENKCPVPYCNNIRHKLRQQQLQQRLQQAHILKRRIASMASMSHQSSQPPPTPQHHFSPQQQQSTSQQHYMKLLKQSASMPGISGPTPVPSQEQKSGCSPQLVSQINANPEGMDVMPTDSSEQREIQQRLQALKIQHDINSP